ncbi:hypothetical protein AB4167_22175 [Vibrio sp. 10N.286.49.E11]|uniref:hypothetical protein n=1 Tax=Vibrio sp. 10N.286.49.E11 TaxID=3229703 RepID=UPI00354ED540
MSRGMIPFDQRSVSGSYDVPSLNSDKLSNSAVQGIINAWDNNTVIDVYGRPWIKSDTVHIVLRTNKDNAAYLIGGLSSEYKYRDTTGLYVRGDGICLLLDSSILNARSMLRENYVKYSQLLYIAIRDCSRARELRGEHYEHVKKLIKTLKRKRINEYEVDFDELTGEVLHGASAEFSHIRSVSIYPELASHIENGLIVNKSTHRIITQNGINDENELLDLCDLNDWDVSWYHNFDDYLEQLGC